MKTDIDIQKNVMEELKSIPLINANEIGVAVKNGIVTLSGIVDSYPKKNSIEKAIKKIAGVKGIAEDLQVNLSEKHQKSDSEIAAMVMSAIEWHSAANIEKINILVEDGIVTIEGITDWNFQRKHVTKVIANIIGVKGIINNIKLTNSPLPGDLKKRIHSSFLRNAGIDADRIDIKIDGHKVILRGKVKSWSEYEDVERAVWSSPGIDRVENKLEIEDDVSVF